MDRKRLLAEVVHARCVAESVAGGARHAAHGAAGGHGANEHAGIEEVVGEADAVAQQRALGEGARRIDCDDADRLPIGAHVPHERADERRLADAGRAGDSDHVRMPGLAV